MTGGQGTASAGTEYRLGVDVGGTFVDFVLATAGVVLGGLQLGALIGLLSFSIWLNA